MATTPSGTVTLLVVVGRVTSAARSAAASASASSAASAEACAATALALGSTWMVAVRASWSLPAPPRFSLCEKLALPVVAEVQPGAHHLDGGGPEVGVEVPHQHDDVALLGVSLDGAQEVVGRGEAPALAPGVEGQGAVVVGEEHLVACLRVLEPDPGHDAVAPLVVPDPAA